MADLRADLAADTNAMDTAAFPGSTIRFFISSTFADFQVERDVLQRRVLPELRRQCAASGFRLQPTDLRWGVSDAAGNDRQTLRICFAELERCRQLSPDFFLLILLGDRYGSCMLPPQAPANVVARLTPHLAPSERAAFEAAYRLDENAIPPEYVLMRAEDPERIEDEALRQAVARAGRIAEFTEPDRLLFEGSATHREIQLGLLDTRLDTMTGTGREPGVLCALRTFIGELGGAAADLFIERDPERAAQLQRLREAVLDRLPADHILRYSVEWPDDHDPAFDADALVDAYLGLLRPRLEAVIASRTAARIAAAAHGRDTVAVVNAAFAANRAACVEGRDTELARVAGYLAGENGINLPLVVAGTAGSGKSTLLAEAATRAANTHPGATLIVRYIGVTPGTETLSALLNDLLQTIARAYGQFEPAPLTDENQLVGAVAAMLATLPAPPERPLLLLLDALDQLSDRTQRTDWLPPRLAPHVRVLVSTLVDRPELGYLSSRLPADQVLTLAPLGREVGRAILRDRLLTAPPRALTSDQEEAVLDAFNACGLPLHLGLLANEARRWRSFDPPRLGAAPLPEDTATLLQSILERLEARTQSGRMLVERSLSDLAAARFGLAEDELLDVLARDDAVRVAQRNLSTYSPPIDPDLPLPSALWARLYGEVAPLLTEREADAGARLLTFYHRQLRAAVEARYLATEEARRHRHRALAEYFANQPWRLGPDHWNWRKARELAPQLERAGNRSAAERALGELADELEQAPDDSPDTVTLITALLDRPGFGGYWRVGLRLLSLQLAAVRAFKDLAGEGAVLNNLGVLTDRLGQKDEARRYFEQALVILRETGNRAGEGSTLNNLARLADDAERKDEAVSYYEQALAIARETGDRAGEGTILANLGSLVGVGVWPEAVSYYEQALAILREVGDRAGEGVTLNNLARIAAALRNNDMARSYREQALAIARETGDRAAEGTTLANLGVFAANLGQMEEAASYYEQALAIARETGDRASEAHTLTNLGALAKAMGRPDETARYFEQALVIFEAIGNAPMTGVMRGNLRWNLHPDASLKPRRGWRWLRWFPWFR